MITVAVPAEQYSGWGGGVQYLLNFIQCLDYVNKTTVIEHLNIIVLMYEGDDIGKKELIKGIYDINPDIKVIRMNKFVCLRSLLNEIKPDILIPVLNTYVRGIIIPQVTYIPDLQEEYLTDLFDFNEVLTRRKSRQYIISKTKNILVSSKIVEKDIMKFYEPHNVNFHVLPCLPLSNRKFWDTSDADIQKYNLPNNYFAVSNQFWMHKDHMTIFKAVDYLINTLHYDVNIVCTGKMEDYRNTEYIESLYKYIGEKCLNNKIKLLGHILRKEQLEIIKRSKGVIQATLFEGGAGGFSAQEAISYGKSVILSNIEINKELQNFNGVYYFEKGNYLSLAKKIIEFNNVIPNDSIKNVERIYRKHLKGLSNFYADLIMKVINCDK